MAFGYICGENTCQFFMKVFCIESGYFSTDGGAMFGIMSRKIWSGKYPVDDENRCPLAMRCFFIDFGQRKVIFDTGVGQKPIGMDYYRFHHVIDIRQALAEKGYQPEDVTDVVLSHLHFDHCGGCTFLDEKGDIQITFPNAKHWTTLAQWQNSLQPGPWEGDAYLRENLQAVDEAGLLQKLELNDDGIEIFPGLQLKKAQGHTFDQLVAFAQTDQGNFCISGDVVPMCLHINAACIAAIDNHAALAVTEKARVLQEAFQQNYHMVFYHDAVTAYASLRQMGRHISAGVKYPSTNQTLR